MANRDRDQRKAQLREARLEQEAEAAAAERRQRMVKLGAAAVFAAIVIIAVAIVISQSGSDSGGGGSTSAALLKGIPQKGTVLGDPAAPVKVLEYGDLQCPVCKEYSATVVADLISGPVRRGEDFSFAEALLRLGQRMARSLGVGGRCIDHVGAAGKFRCRDAFLGLGDRGLVAIMLGDGVVELGFGGPAFVE